MFRAPFVALILLAFLPAALPAWAQQNQAPPTVGTVAVLRQPVEDTTEFVGRIQAIDRVDLSARLTAFLEQRLFTEGTEVKKGDVLYRLEQAPFQADLQSKQAAVQQIEAQLKNANLTLERARSLLSTPAGSRATFDTAEAGQQALVAQLAGAKAQLRQAEINLAYTEIKAPIAGKIGRSAVTEGNVVGPNSGILATIVSQDPMHVTFSVPVRTVLDLQQQTAAKGFDALRIRIRLADGRIYGHSGKIDFVNNSVTGNTDTLALRATIDNPVLKGAADGIGRELFDGELVTVLVESAQVVTALTIPRSAVLTDQAGDFVYTLDAQNRAQRQSIKLGRSTPTVAVVLTGLKEGQTIVFDGLQRVRPGQPVSPQPATNPIAAKAGASGEDNKVATDVPPGPATATVK